MQKQFEAGHVCGLLWVPLIVTRAFFPLHALEGNCPHSRPHTTTSSIIVFQPGVTALPGCCGFVTSS